MQFFVQPRSTEYPKCTSKTGNINTFLFQIKVSILIIPTNTASKMEFILNTAPSQSTFRNFFVPYSVLIELDRTITREVKVSSFDADIQTS